MTYRRAAIPALAGGLLLAAVLWWAGASAAALHLPGSSRVLGIDTASELEHWLAPWSYDPPGADGADSAVDGGGYAVGAGDSGRYLSLYQTAIQIRFGAVFAFFVLGALLLVRRLPPLRGRVWAALLAVWAWGLVAGMLARAVSAPWLIAGQGHGSYRFLPQIASVIASGAQVLVVAALLAAAVTVLLARVTVKGAGPLPQAVVPARAARLAATVGTSLIAVSLVVLSYHPVAAAIQEASTASGLLSDPGDLLRLWLLLGAWAGPEGGSIGDWLLNRVPDVVLLAVVWGALRRLPGLLTRVTVPAMAVGAICATVLGLLASQLLQVLMEAADSGAPWGAPRLLAALGSGVPAALTWGLVAGVAAAATLRVVTDRTGRTEDA
ncbi:hypothetical protein OG730_00970 [Streptomyces sp. NBC_01298]|uniref:hypothetical protein n=1 Tax=Streptomyces sp. NBC_01298 TaxID=2903817 RepID=UPI002E10430A|nr:hypothetical protein OG730_00970 [Streptomyces sp. NBC_01298]